MRVSTPSALSYEPVMAPTLVKPKVSPGSKPAVTSTSPESRLPPDGLVTARPLSTTTGGPSWV